MNTNKLNEAADNHFMTAIPYFHCSDTVRSIADKAFKSGAQWLMQQPLIDRLTDDEKERIIKKYNFNDEAGLATAIRTGEMANKYILMRDLLEDIFGETLFSEK